MRSVYTRVSADHSGGLRIEIDQVGPPISDVPWSWVRLDLLSALLSITLMYEQGTSGYSATRNASAASRKPNTARGRTAQG